MKKILFLCYIAALSINAANLIDNPEFKVNNGKLIGFACPETKDVWNANSGVLTLRENSKKYTSAVSCDIPVDGFKSYRVSFEGKPENLTKMAGVYYYWIDAAGKLISKARFIKQYRNSSSDYQKSSVVITPDDPAKTAKLRICFAIYHAEKSSGAMHYCNPALAVATPENMPGADIKTVMVKKKSPAQELNYKHHNFTYRNQGAPYYLEHGRPGFFDISSRTPYPKSFCLTISAPPEIKFECFLLPYGKKITEQIKPQKRNTFFIPQGIDHTAWGNVLMFKALPGAPPEFAVTLDFTALDGKNLYHAVVPVKVIPAFPAVQLADAPVLRSWYGFPVERANWQAKPENLSGELFRYWNDCGFKGARNPIPGAANWSSYLDYTHVLSHIHPDAPTMPRVTTVSGAFGDELICPSALIRGGKRFFMNEVKRKNRVAELQQGEPRVVSDYEPYAGRNGYVTGHCFCPDCRSAFALSQKLNKVPDTRQILTDYEKEWIRFRLVQRAEVIKAMAQAVHTINPNAKFALCSMPSPGKEEAARYYKEYGIDLKLHDPNVDLHMMMNYSPSIDFFRRLEQDALTLKKPLSPVLDNGWGSIAGYYPERSQLQLLAAAFCGVKEIYFGRGLMLMDGKMFCNLREALAIARRADKFISAGELVESSPLKFYFGSGSDNEVHQFQRKLGDNSWLLLIVNNHPSKTRFGRLQGDFAGSWQELAGDSILSPDGERRIFASRDTQKGIAVKLPPFGKLLLLYRPDGKTHCANFCNVSDTAYEARREKLRFEAMSQPQKKYDMSTRMIAAGFEIATPVQHLLINLSASASGAWHVNGKPAVSVVGLDGMVSPEIQMFKDVPANFVSSEIYTDRVVATFVTRLTSYTYNGLAVNKQYTVWRDKPEIKVAVSVVPEKGYRFFRYRVINIMSAGNNKVSQPYSAHIGYLVPCGDRVIADNNSDNRVYHRDGVTSLFAQDGPAAIFDGTQVDAVNKATGEKVRISFDNAEELFFWRRGNTATVEWLAGDAYPDKDPHKVKVWKTNYTLQYLNGNSAN